MWLDNIERQNYIHASLQATLWNAHFDAGGVPWTAEDFLGVGDRSERKKARLIDKMTTTRVKVAASRVSEAPEWVKEIEENRRKWTN